MPLRGGHAEGRKRSLWGKRPRTRRSMSRPCQASESDIECVRRADRLRAAQARAPPPRRREIERGGGARGRAPGRARGGGCGGGGGRGWGLPRGGGRPPGGGGWGRG